MLGSHRLFCPTGLLTIELWLWFWTNNSSVIWDTRPVIAASADFPTLCSCDGDSRGRRQHPPHEPLRFRVGFVYGRVAFYLFFFLFTLSMILLSRKWLCGPFNFWSRHSLKILSAQALFTSLFAWRLITGLHSLVTPVVITWEVSETLYLWWSTSSCLKKKENVLTFQNNWLATGIWATIRLTPCKSCIRCWLCAMKQ